MAIVVDKRIVDWEVREPPASAGAADGGLVMHEGISRPDVLEGATYRIKTPLSEHAYFVTVNDLVFADGRRYPYEIFINSKNMDHFQWIVAVTRVISSVFRKGGDITFLVEELRSVFDPQGGYFKPGGRFMPSLVAEIGDVIERHMKRIGLLEGETGGGRGTDEHRVVHDLPLCPNCGEAGMISMDGCLTCAACGESECS